MIAVIATILIVIVAVAAALFTVYAAPRALKRPVPSPSHSPADPSFPTGFLWGSGEDAYQHEGGNDNADWYAWERTEPRPFKDGSVAGACADFWNRYEEDFDRAQVDGHNSHRIGIEWSRLEPTMGAWDEGAWAQYRAMVDGMKRRGFVTFVNLWHFTLPAWAAAMGGWECPTVMERWETFVQEAARRLGDAVDYWSTMIDAQIYVLRGYFLGEIPPLKTDQAQGLKMFAALVRAHAAAYRVIKAEAAARNAHTNVGMIYFFALYESRGNPLDSFVTRGMDAVFNRVILDALKTGRLRISIPAGPKIDLAIPEAKGTLDWLGVNYYYREIISFSPGATGFVVRSAAASSAKTDMGWEIYPKGLYVLCHDLAARYSGVPLIIAENGLADDDDTIRPAFIVDHLAWLKKAVDDGLPIFGYSHWAMTDNLEWLDGFEPKFGLYSVDRTTFQRTRTRSAAVFSFIARNNRLPTPAEFAGIQ